MHIYAFGSVCRGDVIAGSDVDLLAVVDGYDNRFDPDAYSIYSYSRLKEIWADGNPFAWHLHLESKLIFSSDGDDYLVRLGVPNTYEHRARDCAKFHDIFLNAASALWSKSNSQVFELSTVFLSIRNIATCFSLAGTNPEFSRYSALRLGNDSVPLSAELYKIFERARILCTRGYGNDLAVDEINEAVEALSTVSDWMKKIVNKAKQTDRILEPHRGAEGSTSDGEREAISA